MQTPVKPKLFKSIFHSRISEICFPHHKKATSPINIEVQPITCKQVEVNEDLTLFQLSNLNEFILEEMQEEPDNKVDAKNILEVEFESLLISSQTQNSRQLMHDEQFKIYELADREELQVLTF